MILEDTLTEVLDILQALVRLRRTQAHQKAKEYPAVLDKVGARCDALSSSDLQRLLFRLFGEPVTANIAGEAASILKSTYKAPDQPQVRPLPPRLGIPLGEDHVSSVAAWAILHAHIGPLRRLFRTDGGVELLVMGGEETLPD